MAAAVSTQSEIFTGWNQAELESLLQTFKAQITEEGLDHVTNASLNGKNAGLGQRMSLKDWMIYLRAALQELDPITYGAPCRVSYASACGYIPK